MSRHLHVIVTDDEADYQVLSRGNDKGKFAIAVEATAPPEIWQAFERGLENEWFRLVDVARLTATNGELARVFRLTDAGRERLKKLSEARS